MIAAAKETPVTNLIEFDRNGKALAFCHDDKTPSLSYNKKANRAHCFPCGKSFNAIDILMVRDNYSFINAVKELCGGAH
jgi:DNA primase